MLDKLFDVLGWMVGGVIFVALLLLSVVLGILLMSVRITLYVIPVALVGYVAYRMFPEAGDALWHAFLN